MNATSKRASSALLIAVAQVRLWHKFPFGYWGRARQLCPSSSDLNFLSDIERVIDLDAKIPHRAFNFGVAQ